MKMPGESESMNCFTRLQIAIVRDAETIIMQDLSKRITAKEMADRFGISEDSFKLYVKGILGDSYLAYFRKKRMEKAAEFLESTNLKVIEIANSVGYENQGKFAKVFAETYGVAPLEKVKELFCNETGYQTPKIDTRAAIFKDDKILLVHENNGTWSLPGGWCDVNVSVTENTIKEVKEEAGLDVTVKSVIAIQDREKHNLPVYAYRICKIFMLCFVTGGNFEVNIETTGFDYFAEDELPELAGEKNNEEQIKMCFNAYRAGDNWKTFFD